VRWAAIEAVARYHGGEPLPGKFASIAERRGKTKANVAIARRVLTLVYYGLRDGEIRCLAGQEDGVTLGTRPGARSLAGMAHTAPRWRSRESD
jgi:hypothetical protein